MLLRLRLLRNVCGNRVLKDTSIAIATVGEIPARNGLGDIRGRKIGGFSVHALFTSVMVLMTIHVPIAVCLDMRKTSRWWLRVIPELRLDRRCWSEMWAGGRNAVRNVTLGRVKNSKDRRILGHSRRRRECAYDSQGHGQLDVL